MSANDDWQIRAELDGASLFPTVRAERITARFPPKLKFLFKPKRYKVAHGGRGSAKSWNFARALIIRAYEQRIRVLCGREFQNSIKESVHALLESQIELLGLANYFRITEASITSHLGSEFIFTGLRNNATKIKSLEGVNIAWIEEAEKVSDRSWEILIPTMRSNLYYGGRAFDSEIWVTFNPDSEDDATYKRFIKHPPPASECTTVKMTWRDNPWFPESLRREKDYLASVDPAAYAHVWEGECRTNSDAQIFNGKYSVEVFEPKPGWHGPYQGADWGFAKDPTTLIRLWIDPDARKLYVEYEAYGIKVDLHKTAELFDRIPDGKRYRTRADNARPETISYMQQHGYPEIVGCEKWPGSVEDGIAVLRQFEQIVIHPRCTHTIEEARLYSYKIDKLTSDVLPDIEDKHNHCWDAIRYALEPIIRQADQGLLNYMRKKKEEKSKEAVPHPGITKQQGTGSVTTTTQEGMSIPSWVAGVMNKRSK
jgi:phage terminase large subunit